MNTQDILLRMPNVAGTIDRRILVNYRCDPAMAARLLPPPFKPKLIRGQAMVGLCLIRLKEIRPVGLPAWVGLTSENAAHRISVEWKAGRVTREGVFVLRRDTGSRLNEICGGRIFPGCHQRADFEVWESDNRFKLAIQNRDSELRIRVVARLEGASLAGSIFESPDEASRFFAAGAMGWSLNRAGNLEGLELRTVGWRVAPLVVERVESSFFDDPQRFQPGSITLDNALLMRNIPHQWYAKRWNDPKPMAKEADVDVEVATAP